MSELLRSQLITPKQALHMAQLRDGLTRQTTLEAIMPLLPVDLRMQAYASVNDILDPVRRIDAMCAFAPLLNPADGDQAYLSALSNLKIVEENWSRQRLLESLKADLAKRAWTDDSYADEAQRIIEQVAVDISYGIQKDREFRTLFSATQKEYVVSSQLSIDTLTLREELSDENVSVDRIYEIVKMVVAGDDEESTKIFEFLLPRLPEDLYSDVVDLFPSNMLGIYDDQIRSKVSALVPYLNNELLKKLLEKVVVDWETSLASDIILEIFNHFDGDNREWAFQKILTIGGIFFPTALDPILEKMSKQELARALPVVFSIEDDVEQRIVVEMLLPYLSRSSFQMVLEWAVNLQGDYSDKMVATLVSYCPAKVAMQLVKSNGGSVRARTLIRIIPNLPKKFFPEAVKLIEQIADVELRRNALEEMLPRLREMKMAMNIREMHALVYLIEDVGDRVFTEAVLIPLLDTSDRENASSVLSSRLNEMIQSEGQGADFVLALGLALASINIPVSDPHKVQEWAITRMRNTNSPLGSALGLALISTCLFHPSRESLMQESIDRDIYDSGGRNLALLAALHEPEKIRPMLEFATQYAKEIDDSFDRDSAMALINIVAAFIDLDTATTLKQEIAPNLAEIGNSDVGSRRLQVVASAVVLVFGPSFTPQEVETLSSEIFNNLQHVTDLEERSLILALIAPYLPSECLWECFKQLISTASRAPRYMVLFDIALSQGIIGEYFKHNPRVGGSRISEPSMLRLGGTTAVYETLEAIRDVCSWWP